jgi:hypothetical protein
LFVCFDFAAGFGGDYRVDDEEWERVGFEHLDCQVCLRGRVCGGGLQCGFGRAVASHGVSSSAQAFELCRHVTRWAIRCSWRGKNRICNTRFENKYKWFLEEVQLETEMVKKNWKMIVCAFLEEVHLVV